MNSFALIGIVLAVYMTLWFGVSVALRRNDVADIAWGLGFVLVAWTSYALSIRTGLALLINIFVTIWGLRLAGHIYLRNRHKPEDARYAAWRAEWRHVYLRSFLQIFLLQGALLYLIALPVMIANFSSTASVGVTAVVGSLIWVVGIVCETVADSQLKKYISDPAHRGTLMTRGLWRYSRHPNYFGEVTGWWGIWIMTLGLPSAVFGILGPLTITTLILFVSGVPMLERKYAGRPDFEEYRRQTSMFVPLPVRR